MRRNPNRQIAEDAGEKYYFSGSPCRRAGHLSERYTANGACVACGQEYTKSWRENNSEHTAAYAAIYRKGAVAKAACKAWRQKHPEKVKEIYAAWVAKNGDERNAKRRAAYKPHPRTRDPEAPKRAAKRWRERNREFDRARAAKWRRENPELAKAVRIKWRSIRKNKNTLLAKEHRRRALKKGGGGSYVPVDIERIFSLQKGKCGYCRTKLGELRHIDHIVPLSKGGTNDKRNLQLLCAPCNLSKGAKDQIEFMRTKGRLL